MMVHIHSLADLPSSHDVLGHSLSVHIHQPPREHRRQKAPEYKYEEDITEQQLDFGLRQRYESEDGEEAENVFSVGTQWLLLIGWNSLF